MQPEEKRTFIEILNVIVRRWKMVLGLVAFSALGAFVQHFLFPEYVAHSSLIIRTDNNSPLLRIIGKISGTQNGSYGVESTPSDEMTKILRANSFHIHINERVKYEIANKSFPKPDFRKFFVRGSKASAETLSSYILSKFNFKLQDDIITFNSYSNNPAEAEAIVRWVTNTAKRYLVSYETKEVLETEQYLKKEVDDTQDRIKSLNAEIDKLRNDPNMFSVKQLLDVGAVNRSISKIQEELEDVRIRKSEIEYLSTEYDSKIKEMNGKEAHFDEQKKMVLRGRIIDGLKELQAEREVLLAKEHSLTTRLTNLTATLKPQNEQVLFDLKKKLELEHELMRELQRQIYTTRIYQISAENKIRTYEMVQAGSAARSITLIKKFGLAIVIALMIALAIVFVWEQMYPVMSLKHDFLHFGVRYLGSIPELFDKGLFPTANSPSKNMMTRMGTLLRSGVRTPESTAIQFLAARVLHNFEKIRGERRGVVSVISCNSGEGKTLISNCLASAFGTFGLKVLLVEGDTLRSKGENMFGIPSGEGFAEVMQEKSRLQDVVKATDFKNVFYCSRGLIKPDVAHFHAGEYVKFLNSARAQYDLVIVDTPAFSVGPEALLMAGHSNMGLVIAEAHRTKQEDFAELVESLHLRGLKDLYAISNRSGHKTATAEAYYYKDQLKNIQDEAS